MTRTKAISTPEELETLFSEYKTWVSDNPYKVHDYVGKDAVEVRREKQRPLTWKGFEAWLYRRGILQHLGHYEQNTGDAYTDYLPIIRALKAEVSADIVDGALAGVYNQNIAARIEGLTDKSEHKHEGLPAPEVSVTIERSKEDE